MNFTADTLATILDEAPVRPSVFVETGTQRGRTTLMVYATGHFEQIITCDRSEHFAAACRHLFRGRPIVYRQADSREVLRTVPAVPCFFYLDAHWDRTAGGVASYQDMPLWDELAILARRAQPDVVVVDDVHAFGRGPEETGTPLWLDVSAARIAAALHPVRSRVIGDQFVCYRS